MTFDQIEKSNGKKKPVEKTINNITKQTQSVQSVQSNQIIQTQPYQVQEQFCSCCKPADFFDFLNKKKPLDVFCSETFVSDLKSTNNPSKTHKIFVKKNDI